MKKMEKAIVAGDFHIPFHSENAIKVFLRFVRWFKPDVVFLNGDIIDCWEISKFVRPLSIKQRMADEITYAVDFLEKLRKVHKGRIIYIFGNHEFRFEKFIALNARELEGLKGMTLEEQLEFSRLGIEAVNHHQREQYYRYGHLLIGHFNKTNKHSAYTAKNLLEEKGMSLIQAHTHRGGCSYKRDYREQKVAFEGFCMCDLEPSYCTIPNWQQGFLVVHTKPNGLFNIHAVNFIGNEIAYPGF